eukprot:m.184399 g.184399  ORF g.184399 m.184399 type:complete len:141 (-) comp32186_c0_seq3:24-446(-)
MMHLMIQHSADLNQRDSNGNTPLHLAACTKHVKMVTLLMDSGCDIAAKNGFDRTPLHYAESHLRMLRKADPNNVAARKGELVDIVKMITTYLQKLARDDACCEVLQLAERLANSSTSDEVNEVAGMLASFTSISLKSMKT